MLMVVSNVLVVDGVVVAKRISWNKNKIITEILLLDNRQDIIVRKIFYVNMVLSY